MLIPSFVYGLYRDVKKECNKICTKLKRGASWQEATAAPLLDTKGHGGLIVLSGPCPLVGGENHFHMYVLLQRLRLLYHERKMTREAVEQLYLESLGAPWGVLSAIAARGTSNWLITECFRSPFMKAVVPLWDEFVDEGKRYTAGNNYGEHINLLTTEVDFVLANMGVPNEELDQLFRTRDLRRWLEEYGPLEPILKS